MSWVDFFEFLKKEYGVPYFVLVSLTWILGVTIL